jgi:hypothetical protein
MLDGEGVRKLKNESALWNWPLLRGRSQALA